MGTQLHLQKGHSLQFLAYAGCGQTAGWIKMPLGTKVGLGSGDIVLDGTKSPPLKGAQPSNFVHWIMSKLGHWSSQSTAVLGRFFALDHKPWLMNVKHCLTARPFLRP